MRHNGLQLLVPLGVSVLLFAGCQTSQDTGQAARAALKPQVDFPAVGKIERLDPAAEAMFPAYTQIERVAQGFVWAEGPVWVAEQHCLMFSDVPKNVVYRWTEPRGDAAGLSVFLRRSGYTGPEERAGESGSNGLTLDPKGRLVLCQHGDRRVARLEPNGRFKTLAAYYKFLRFNSPNDLVYRSNGDLYFTDPPYGLEGGNQDPKREIMFNGVYRMTPDGEVAMLTNTLTFPNGIAFSPDESTLYVAVSDPARPVIVAYDMMPDGSLGPERVFFDAKPLAAEGRQGLPDGLKTDLAGNVFATGPGGVLVISPRGRLLAILDPGSVVANVAWGNDGTVLYMTAKDSLCRVRTFTSGFEIMKR